MTELKKLIIETSVDRLVDLVKRRGKLTLEQAASEMGADVDQVENWVKILEEHGYVKMVYPPVGVPEIVLGELPGEFFVRKTSEFEKRKGLIESKASEYEQLVLGLQQKSKISNAKFTQLHNELTSKLREAEEHMNALQELREEREKLLKETEKLNEETKEATKKISEVERLAKDAKGEVEDQIAKLRDYGKYSGNLEVSRREILNEIEALNREMRLVQRLASKRGGKQMMMHKLSHVVPGIPKFSLPKIKSGAKPPNKQEKKAPEKIEKQPEKPKVETPAPKPVETKPEPKSEPIRIPKSKPLKKAPRKPKKAKPKKTKKVIKKAPKKPKKQKPKNVKPKKPASKHKKPKAAKKPKVKRSSLIRSLGPPWALKKKKR